MAKVPDWLKLYREYTKLSESPEIFHFWTGVSTLAGALRRRVWIDQRYFQWVPNFYIIFVAPAGVVSKSTTIRYGLQLLREVEGVRFGPESGTWQALAEKLMQAQELVPIPMNGHASLEGEMDTMACITCAPSELGTFLDFQDRKLIDVLTALWDGQRETFEHSTRSQGTISILNPWVNLISATTPAWLKRNVPDEAIGAGFASRVVFVFASKKRSLVAYPGLTVPQEEHQALRQRLIEQLREVASLYGEMILTPEAIKWGVEWYEKHWAERPIHMASERFSGYIARKQTHIHKLAMVLSVSHRRDLIIDVGDLQKAERVTSAMEEDMIRVFESIGVAPTSKLLAELIQYLSTYQQQSIPVTEQMLWRHAMQMMTQQEFSETINAGVRAGYLKIRNVGGEHLFEVLAPPDADGGNANAASAED